MKDLIDRLCELADARHDDLSVADEAAEEICRLRAERDRLREPWSPVPLEGGLMSERDAFIRHYVLQRASTFRAGHEREDAWTAIQDGARVWNMLERENEKYRSRIVAAAPAGLTATEIKDRMQQYSKVVGGPIQMRITPPVVAQHDSADWPGIIKKGDTP